VRYIKIFEQKIDMMKFKEQYITYGISIGLDISNSIKNKNNSTPQPKKSELKG